MEKTMELTRNELDKWQDDLVGKSCPKHPENIIKRGQWGNWCGHKDKFGWCDGGFPTEEWLNNLRKESL